MQQFSLWPSSPNLEAASLKSPQERAGTGESPEFSSTLKRAQKTQSVQSEAVSDESLRRDLNNGSRTVAAKNVTLNTNTNQLKADASSSQTLPQMQRFGEILPLSESDYAAVSLADAQRARDIDSTISVSSRGLTSADVGIDGAPLSLNEQAVEFPLDEGVIQVQRLFQDERNSLSSLMTSPQPSDGLDALIGESNIKSGNVDQALLGIDEDVRVNNGIRANAAASFLGLSSTAGVTGFYATSDAYPNPSDAKSNAQQKTSGILGTQANALLTGNAVQGAGDLPFLAKQVSTAGIQGQRENNSSRPSEGSTIPQGYMGGIKGASGSVESPNELLNSGLSELPKSSGLRQSLGRTDASSGITPQIISPIVDSLVAPVTGQPYGASLISNAVNPGSSLGLNGTSATNLPQTSGVSFKSELNLRQNSGEKFSNPVLMAGQTNQSGDFSNALVTESDQLFKVDVAKSIMESLLGGDSTDESDLGALSDRGLSKANSLAAKESAGLAARPYVSALHLPVDDAQWMNSLSEKLMWLSSRQINTTELHLNPADLGPIDVRIQVQGDQTNINFNAQSASVRELLEVNIQRLRDMLGESMNDAEIDLSMNDAQDERFGSESFTSHQDAEDARFNGANDRAETESGEHAVSDDNGANFPSDSERLINARV